MKLSKNLGRIATTFLATAMLASVSAVPAFANTPTWVGDLSTNLKSTAVVSIKKQIRKADNVYLPNAEFEFDLTPWDFTAHAEDADATYGNGAAIQKTGEGQSAVEDTIVSTATEQGDITTEATGNISNVTLKDDLKIDLNADAFGEPGTYYFLLTEQAGSYPNGLSWNAQYMQLKVVIVRDVNDVDKDENTDDLMVYGYELRKCDEDGSDVNNEKTDTIVNNYGIDSGDKDLTKDYDLSKVLTGNYLLSTDQSGHYTFSVTVTNTGDSAQKYYAIITHGSTCDSTHSSKQIVTLTANSAQNINIAQNDTFCIEGLTSADTVTVVENDYTGDNGGFDAPAYEIDGGNTENASNDERTAQVSNFTKDHAVVCTNNKSISNPTGIVMDVAPYVLLVVVAAAGCFVFLRKRRED